MSRKFIAFLCALTAAVCFCASSYADVYSADINEEHALENLDSSDLIISDSTITKKGSPSGSVGDEYEYLGANSTVLLSNDVNASFSNVILRSRARYAQGIFLLASDDTAYSPTVLITSSDIATYEEHSDGVYNSNGTLNINTSQIAAGKLGASSCSPAVTTYGNAASTVLEGVSAWTSGDNSPVLKVYGTDTSSTDTYHLSVNTPPEGFTNDFYSYGKDSPVLYSTGSVQITSAVIGTDCSAGVVVDGSGQVFIHNTSIDLGYTYAPTAKTVEHPAIQLGSTTFGNAGFSMTDGYIAADTGDVFLVKGTNASITLSGVEITNDSSANFLKAESTDSINSTAVLSVTDQRIIGKITAESGSSIDVYLGKSAVFVGSVNSGIIYGSVSMDFQADSGDTPPTWYLTANSRVSSLTNKGVIIAGPYKLYVGGSLYSSDIASADGGAFYADYEMSGDSKAITIMTTTFPSGKTGSPYLADIDAESHSPISWDIADGSLPEGLSLNDDGTISGTPTTPGTYTFIVRAFNDSYITAKLYTLVITDGSASSVKIETTSLNGASTHSPYSAALAASGAGTIVWSIDVGFSLPSGLELDEATGIISGTPTKIGTYTFMVRASASSENYDTKLLTIIVTEGSDVFVITTDTLKNATVNKTYSVTLKAKGTGLTWTAESLPEGLSITEAGKITGKATEAGTYNPSFTVTNGVETATSTLVLTVVDIKPKIKASIKAGLIDTAYSAAFVASAGTGDITWALSGDLPNGLSFDAEKAVIFGMPTEGWKDYIIIRATNSGGTTSKKCKLQIKAVKPKITFKNIPAATFEESYDVEAELTGSQPIVLTVKGLPEGLSYDYDSFDEVVRISGIPTKGGKFSVKLTASNVQGKTTKSGRIVVNFPPTFKDVSLPEAYTGKNYSTKIPADGTKKITWAIVSGDLPADLELKTKNGQIKGKALEGGTFSFIVEASNAYGTAQKSFDLVVNITPPKISTSSLKRAKYGKSYYMLIKTKDGTPDTWDITGELPSGITFHDGVFSGTPEEAFTGSVTVTASNAGGSSAKTYVLRVTAEAPKITTSSLPSGSVGSSYSAALEATGTPQIVWRWSGYPTGLTLDKNTGAISGTPTKAGTFKITVTAENEAKRVSKKYKVEITDNGNGAAGNVGESPEGREADGEGSELERDIAADEQGLGAEYYSATGELPEGFVIAAEIPEVSVDVSGMYEFDAVLSEAAPVGAKMYWVANSEKPSEDDAIAEFFGEDGQEIDVVPESMKVCVSAWLNAGVTYRPVIAVKK